MSSLLCQNLNKNHDLDICDLICDNCMPAVDLEECQLSECGAEEELGHDESPLPRSSSTSDITQQLSESIPGILEIIMIIFLTYVCS